MSATGTSSREATEALAQRLFAATIETLEVASVRVGLRLGLYRALAGTGDGGNGMTPAELAKRTGTAERYVREWLEQQSVAGFLAVDSLVAAAGDRRYSLPAAHEPVLVDEGSLDHVAPLAQLAMGVLRPMDALLAAYRNGGGVPYEDYGADTRDGISGINRPMFEHQLAGWLESIPDVHSRLEASPPARVADVACGSAWSSIAIARAYPRVTVDAIDSDPESIRTARANVAAAGLSDRVTPILHDASHSAPDGGYALVCIFEALHDMNHPVEALRQARAMLADGGSVLVAEERVGEDFTAPGDELERFNYGWSILHCLPVASLDEDSAATGTVIRPGVVRAYGERAGFSRFEELPIRNDFWRFYRLSP